LYSDTALSAGFTLNQHIEQQLGYFPPVVPEPQGQAAFLPSGITSHIISPSNEISFPLFGIPFDESQQYPFEPLDTYNTFPCSYDPAAHTSHFISHVNGFSSLQTSLGDFSFDSSPSLPSVIPLTTVQSPIVPLPGPTIFNSDQSHLLARDNQTPLAGSHEPPQSLSSTDEIHCTWPSCNKVFSSIHTYKCVTSRPVLTLTNMMPASTPRHTPSLSNVLSAQLDMIPSVTATDTSMNGTTILKGIIVEFLRADARWLGVEKPSRD